MEFLDPSIISNNKEMKTADHKQSELKHHDRKEELEFPELMGKYKVKYEIGRG